MRSIITEDLKLLILLLLLLLLKASYPRQPHRVTAGLLFASENRTIGLGVLLIIVTEQGTSSHITRYHIICQLSYWEKAKLISDTFPRRASLFRISLGVICGRKFNTSIQLYEKQCIEMLHDCWSRAVLHAVKFINCLQLFYTVLALTVYNCSTQYWH